MTTLTLAPITDTQPEPVVRDARWPDPPTTLLLGAGLNLTSLTIKAAPPDNRFAATAAFNRRLRCISPSNA